MLTISWRTTAVRIDRQDAEGVIDPWAQVDDGLELFLIDLVLSLKLFSAIPASDNKKLWTALPKRASIRSA